MLTDKRVLILSKNNKIKWEKPWDDIIGSPDFYGANGNTNYDFLYITIFKEELHLGFLSRSPVPGKLVV